jgi:hypothetical protein
MGSKIEFTSHCNFKCLMSPIPAEDDREVNRIGRLAEANGLIRTEAEPVKATSPTAPTIYQQTAKDMLRSCNTAQETPCFLNEPVLLTQTKVKDLLGLRCGPLTSRRERRTSGPENFPSQTKRDFFNTIGPKRT